MDDDSPLNNPTPGEIMPAGARTIGLFPAGIFVAPSASRRELDDDPLARWYFREESIVVPASARELPNCDQGNASEQDEQQTSETLPEAPPLVWTAAESCIPDVRISEDGSRLFHGSKGVMFRLTERHPLNQAFFDPSSLAWLQERALFVRGTMESDSNFVARTLWPEDFVLPDASPLHPVPADPLAIRARIRHMPAGGARCPFSVETLWRAPDTTAPRPGQPAIAFILNGAQGDDDEAHGGHFAIATGHIGEGGSIHDWLVTNFYTLDNESEKGIIAASVPLDNYFADLNAGQAWYRPSHILVTTLRRRRVATMLQSRLSAAFRDFYCRRLRYHHATANCAGISVSILRALGWHIPARSGANWLEAFSALLLTSARTGSLARGKMLFDYLTEDRTRLYPAAAFEEIGADLLRLVNDGRPTGGLSRFEHWLAEDIDSLMLVCIPQFPSSRAWGDHAVVDSREYRDRLPAHEKDRRIVPVGPRHPPEDLQKEGACSAGWQRSDYAVICLGGLIATTIAAWLIA